MCKRKSIKIYFLIAVTRDPQATESTRFDIACSKFAAIELYGINATVYDRPESSGAVVDCNFVYTAYDIQITDIFAPGKTDDTGSGDIKAENIEGTVSERNDAPATVDIQ